MAQTVKQKVAELEAFINKGTLENFVLEIVKFSATNRKITSAMKDKNITDDEDIANLFTKLILQNAKATPTNIVWKGETEIQTKYPSDWFLQKRNYDLDTSLWIPEKGTGLLYDFFGFLAGFAEGTQTLGNKFWSLMGGGDDADNAKDMLKGLQKYLKDTKEDAALFEAMAKSAIISKLMYMYLAHLTSAIAVMYFDAVLGYLMISTYWNDGAAIGPQTLKGVLGDPKTGPGVLFQPYSVWEPTITNFPQLSFNLLQKIYDLLGTDTRFSGTTVYKPKRMQQLQTDQYSQINMLVIINEKFNINCDTEYKESSYRADLGNQHYKKFKIITPD